MWPHPHSAGCVPSMDLKMNFKEKHSFAHRLYMEIKWRGLTLYFGHNQRWIDTFEIQCNKRMKRKPFGKRINFQFYSSYADYELCFIVIPCLYLFTDNLILIICACVHILFNAMMMMMMNVKCQQHILTIVDIIWEWNEQNMRAYILDHVYLSLHAFLVEQINAEMLVNGDGKQPYTLT